MTFTFGGVNPVTDDIDLEGNDLTDSTQDTVDVDKNIRVTDGSELAYGRNNKPLGKESQAIGIGAAAPSGFTTATGTRAAQNSSQISTTATGFDSAQNNTGKNVTATGTNSAQDNTGTRATATGFASCQNNTGDNAVGTGSLSLRNNTGNFVVGIGDSAGNSNTGDSIIAIGQEAVSGDGLSDPSTMGDDNIGIGESALRRNQASGLIGIGRKAGIDAQQDDQLIITDRNGNRRMVMDLTNGDLKIDGSLTQNANL